METLPQLSPDAQRYLHDFYHVLQAWDDFVDGDEMGRAEKDKAIYASLVGIPSNPFFVRNAAILMSIHANVVLKWKASDTIERSSGNMHMAYAWRAGFFDLVLQVFLLEFGSDKTMKFAHLIAGLYGERFEDYRKEFPHA